MIRWDRAHKFYNDLTALATTRELKPSGVTVHYTASGEKLDGLFESMRKQKVGYHFMIERDGTIWQTAALNLAVNHAGVAKWNGRSPNRTHIAVALVSWGLLDSEGKSYAGVRIPKPRLYAGKLWEAATEAQIDALFELMQGLLKEFAISPMDICGHDECAQPLGRKVDPGGTLGISMEAFRDELDY